jgi:hypothetical protein
LLPQHPRRQWLSFDTQPEQEIALNAVEEIDDGLGDEFEREWIPRVAVDQGRLAHGGA